MSILIGRRGANARETPQGKRGNSLALAFPSLLRVSLSRSPFRDSLSPKGVSLVLWRKVYAKLSVQSSCGSSERHTSNSNARQAAYAKRVALALRGKGNEERGARGENLKGKGGMRACEFPPCLFGFSPRTRAPRPTKINLWKKDKEYYAEYLKKATTKS